jgi:hypothetical protein
VGLLLFFVESPPLVMNHPVRPRSWRQDEYGFRVITQLSVSKIENV